MANIKIPERHLSGIEHISLLDEKDIKLVYKVLESLPIGIGHRQYIKLFDDKTKFDNNISVAEAIFSFSGLLTDKQYNIEELSAEITEAFTQLKGTDLNLKQANKLRGRISEVLKRSKILKSTFEAHRIIFDSNKVYINSEINTDINMIYDKDSNNHMQYGVLMHKLRIVLSDDSDGIIVSLDREDLGKLKAQIELALDENEQIRNTYKDLINFIEIAN